MLFVLSFASPSPLICDEMYCKKAAVLGESADSILATVEKGSSTGQKWYEPGSARVIVYRRDRSEYHKGGKKAIVARWMVVKRV